MSNPVQKILSLVLAFAITLGMTPITVIAAEGEEVPQDSGTSLTMSMGISNISDSGATLEFASNQDGKVYYMLQEASGEKPANVEAVKSGEPVTVVANSVVTAAAISLAPNTAYAVYGVAESGGQTSEIVAALFTTGKTQAVSELSDANTQLAAPSMMFSAMSGLEDITWYDKDPNAPVFMIATADQLAGLALLVNDEMNPVSFEGKTVVLQNSISLSDYASSTGWTPIGIAGKYFKGTFNGAGNTIRGLVINNNTDNYNGLFGYIDSGTVQNVRLEDISINAASLAGGIAGEVAGTGSISNCYASGTITGQSNLGGIVGRGIDIENCASSATVSGTANIGGIAGTSKGIVQNCYATGMITAGTGTNNRAGGIVGYVNGGVIKNCAALNYSVSCNTAAAGRIAGGGTASFQKNYAWEGMTVNAATISDGEADNKNGASKSGGEWRSAATWSDSTGLNWSNLIWTIVDNLMPQQKIFGGRAMTDIIPFYIPSTPAAPTNVTAVAGDGQATVSFTTPSGTVTGYTVTSAPDGITAAGTSSPITVIGLTNGTAYTFTVKASNAQGEGSASAASSAVIPKGSQAAPAAPTMLSRTASGITLNDIAGAEYSRNGTDWQDGTAFTGLTPNTGYVFYARLKEMTDKNASPSSPASAVITTDKAALAGSVSLIGLPAFGQVLTAETTSLTTNPAGTAMGTLSCQWTRDGVDITGATGSAYTLTAADVGKVINVKVTSANCTGSISSINITTVGKAAQAAPAAPTMASSTATGITLAEITGAEYRLESGIWQDEAGFAGLTPNTNYTFYARLKETNTHQASPDSTGSTITTLKLPQMAPTAPTMLSRTTSSITLDTIIGAEYSKNGTDWQDGTTFTGLIPNTGYTFYARLKETAVYEVSPVSAASANITTDSATLAGTVALLGVPVFGQELTAGTPSLVTDPAGVAMGTLNYQWLRNGTGIAGATGSTYTLSADDVGAVISVSVTAENCTGGVTSANSPAILKAPAPPPAITVINKTATTVRVKAVSPSTPTGLKFLCKTDNSLPVTGDAGWQDSDLFERILPNTTYYFFAYLTETSTMLPSPVSSGISATTEKAPITGTVSVTGEEKFGETITATVSGVTGTFIYTWFRSGTSTAIQTGSSNTYQLTQADIGKAITVEVTEANHSRFITGTTGMITKAGGPAAPTSGVADDTANTFGFTVVPGYNDVALYEYSTDGGASWTDMTGNPVHVGDVDIAAGDLQIRLKATDTHFNGAILSSSTAFTPDLTGRVSISGAAIFGETLTASAEGTQSGASLVFLWYRNGDSTSIHTGSTYKTAQADIGRFLRVEATSPGFGSKLTSPATAVVGKAIQEPPTLAYTRSGDYATSGVTVTVTSPASGATYSFDGSAYSTANSHTFAQGITSAVIYAKLDETPTHMQSGPASLQLDFTKKNQAAPVVELSATAGEAAIMLHIIASGGKSGNYAYKIGTGSFIDLPADGKITLTTPGETIMMLLHDKGDEYYNQSPDAAQTTDLPKYTNSATVAVSVANFTRTQTNITMSAAPIASNGGKMEYSFDGSTYVELDTKNLPSFTGLSAGSSHTIALRVKGDAQREAGTPTSIDVQTASSSSNPGGGNSNGGNSGWSNTNNNATGSGSSNTAKTPTERQPEQPVTGNIEVGITIDKNGHTVAALLQQAVTDAIVKAMADAKAQNRSENGIGIAVLLKTTGIAKSFGIVLTEPILKSLTDSKVQLFEVDGAIAALSLNLEALKEIRKQSTGDVTIMVKPVQNLSEGAKVFIGVRPVYEITFTYVDRNGKTRLITNLGNGGITLSLPYAPGQNEAIGCLYGVYVDSSGNPSRIEGSAYDSNTGSLIFITNHFSVYGVGYTAQSVKFTDISKHWAKESIDYMVGRGLLSGTSDTTFAPDTAMTRGMLAAALGRLAGIDVNSYKTGSFTDVKAGNTFQPYIEWAYKKGIINGAGNNLFAPDRAVTREEIAVIIANYAKAAGYTLPVNREVVLFTDNSSIGSSYLAAVKAMQQAGIMMGGSGNKFNPKANATRAEVSVMLHRYIKLTIDPATAQGWALNDAGQYLYYKEGKALSGWQTISSKASKKRYYFDVNTVMVCGKWLKIEGKWYYFYADGSLAVSTTINDYEVDENGVRKEK